MFDLFGGGGGTGIQVRIGADISELQRKLDRVGKSFGQLGKRLTATVTAPLAAFGAAAVKFAIDAEETAQKFDVVFGDAADSVRARFAELTDVIPLTTQQLEGLASGVQDLLVPLGLARDEAARFSTQAVELAADIASFNNVAADVPLEALKSALAGQSQPLRQFGIDVSQARLELLALEEGLIGQGEELNNAARAQAIFIAAQRDSEDAIGDAARTADSAANQLRFLRRDVTQLAEDIGQKLIPVVAPLVERLRSVVNIFGTLSPQLQQSTIIIAALAAAAGPLLLGLAGISAALAAISAPVVAVVAGIGALTAIVIKSGVSFSDLASVATSAWASIRQTVQPVVEALQRLFQVLRERIGGLIEAFGPQLSETAGTTFRFLQRVASAALQNVATLLEALASFIDGDFRGVFAALGRFVRDTFKGIADVILTAVRVILNATASVANNLPLVGDAVASGLQTAAAAVDDIRPRFFEGGKNAAQGFRAGFAESIAEIGGDVAEIQPRGSGGGVGGGGRSVEVLDVSRIQAAGLALEEVTAETLRAEGAFQTLSIPIENVADQIDLVGQLGREALEGFADGFGRVIAQAVTFDESISSIGDAFRSLGRVIQQVLQRVIQQLVAAAIQAAILTAITGGAGGFGATFTQILGGGNPATGAARVAPSGGSLSLQQGSTIVLPSGDIQAAVRIGSQRTARGSARGS